MCGRNYNHSGRFGRIPWPLKMLGALVFIPGFLFLGTWVTWMLWNALMPAIFGLMTITFWQTMGLLVLAKILFGSHGRRGFGPGGFPRRPNFKDRDAWREHLRERFADGNWGPGGAGAERHFHHRPSGPDHPLSEEADTGNSEKPE